MDTTVDVRASDDILKRMRSPSRTRTSYASMNEWLQIPGKTVPTARPVIRDLSEWRELPRHQQAAMQNAQEEMDEAERYPDISRPDGPEDGYKRTYDNLTNQIAYRWPNPGTPRAREGCIGGTWRHVKEVLVHGGSRFVFVDGLVSVYDNQKFTERLQAQLPYRPHIKLLYAPLLKRGDETPRGAMSSRYSVLPEVGIPAASMSRDPNVQRKMELQKQQCPTNRRGFYKFP
ncbi:uncharacterized protein [Littorina saxatilis]|uniref:uncharacterized protein isoform X2 n=1 Tax=Littorina saxatilis TaxID=31220 RepID=UPI0038B5D43C